MTTRVSATDGEPYLHKYKIAFYSCTVKNVTKYVSEIFDQEVKDHHQGYISNVYRSMFQHRLTAQISKGPLAMHASFSYDCTSRTFILSIYDRGREQVFPHDEFEMNYDKAMNELDEVVRYELSGVR
jgi:hypothetical protein